MTKIFRLNNYHRIDNFPKRSSIFKRMLSQALFAFLVTKVTMRQNHLEKDDELMAEKLIQKGDLVLAGGFRAISGIFMGKFFTHSLLYVGNGECIHADADGVDTIPFKELFTAYDTLTILRPQIKDNYEETIEKVIVFAHKQIGKPYDFLLEHRNDRYFCTQLINVSFEEAGFDTGVGIKDKIRQDFLWIFWRIRKVVRADDFLRGNFDTIFISKSLKEKNQEIEKLNNIKISKK
ncbi:MAG: YiiX/YebB-like N1pC/P60 family cysteine hydrolase [Candidatus Falkowbacteria bacterium]